MDERDVAAGFGGRWPVEGETEGAGSALSRLGIAWSFSDEASGDGVLGWLAGLKYGRNFRAYKVIFM